MPRLRNALMGVAAVALLSGSGMAQANPIPPFAPIPFPHLHSISPATQASSLLSVLPFSSLANWTFTPTSPQTPVSPSASTTLGYAKVSADIWNLSTSATGSISLASTTNGLSTNVALSNPSQGSSNTWVRAYPSVSVGPNLFSLSSSPPVAPQLGLPRAVSGLTSLQTSMRYSISAGSQTSYDWAYDVWLEHSATPAVPGAQDLELMVWTDYASDPELLPPGYKTTKALVSTINGVTNARDFKVYMTINQATGKTIVWLVLATPVSNASVQFDLINYVDAASTLLNTYEPAWNGVSLKSYYLDSIDLGSEVGPLPGPLGTTSTAPLQLSSLLSQYSLATYTGVPIATPGHKKYHHTRRHKKHD